jgi:hypothetical protein
VSSSAPARNRARPATGDVRLARAVIDAVGGRYSTRLGIDVDAGPAEVERWFLASTLFGNRIAASVAERTFCVLGEAGLRRIVDARAIPWDDLVILLDAGGYTRYDFRTATRLHALADVIRERHHGSIGDIGRRSTTYPGLRDALEELPGWGPVTGQLFLRELRGVWPGADPPLAERAARAGHHLGLFGPRHGPATVRHLERLADACRCDVRDLESGLVRFTLEHHRSMDRCPGGTHCLLLSRQPSRSEAR